MKKENKIYPGEILEIDDKSVKLNTIEPTGNGKFNCPTEKDIHENPNCDTVKKMNVQHILIGKEAYFIFLNKSFFY